MSKTEDTPLEIKTEDTEILTIKDESQFHSLIEAEKEKHTEKTANVAFDELGKTLHEALSHQDSEGALSLITK